MSTDLLEKIETETTDTDGPDRERFSHYVDKEDIVRATFDGIPATALCGKTWAANKSPEKYPVCPECKDIYENVVQKG